MYRTTRRAVLAAAGTTALAGCLEGFGGSDPTTTRSTGTTTTGATADAEAAGTAAATAGGPPLADARLPLADSPATLREHVVSGGPGRDGIPSIDDPSFVAAADVDYLRADDVVFGVARGDDVKAYPQSILVWHEIVNDALDGTPTSVTYCPLTGTAIGFERGETTFGVSGRLVNNNLVMYDRATDSRWPQVLATAISGPLAGRSLREVRVVWTTWADWRDAHPETRALSEDTGYVRNYDRDPYGSYTPRGGYYASDGTLFERLHPDDRYHPKETVVGARTPNGAVAFLKSALRDDGVIEGALAETPLVAVHDPKLDTAYVYRNPDEAAVRADGDAVVGPDGARHDPASLPLDRVHAFDAMWFAWSGFYPETEVYE